MPGRKTIYMKVTRDEYELPVAVADSPKELAAMLGITSQSICSQMSRDKHRGSCPYRKVVIEDGDE